MCIVGGNIPAGLGLFSSSEMMLQLWYDPATGLDAYTLPIFVTF